MRTDSLQMVDVPAAAPPTRLPMGMSVVEKAGASTSERRCCKRFGAATGAFAILRPCNVSVPPIRDMGMGDIAFAVYRLRPQRMGQIIDICLDGLSFSYVRNGLPANGPLALDILSADTGFYLKGLAFEPVWDQGAADEIDTEYVPLRHCGLRFQAPDPSQRRQLSLFMRQHTHL